MNNPWPHQSVLSQEANSLLAVKAGAWYVDATLGAGGHTANILKAGGRVIGIDRDLTALNLAKTRFNTPSLQLLHGNFKNLAALVTSVTLEPVAGILFDLGVSSMQFDQAHRGFSFREEAPLDMRMDQSETTTAADIVNQASASELYALFMTAAQEKHARNISQAIVAARKDKPIVTTLELANLIEKAAGKTPGSHLHPATKVFQALRMAVNDEIPALKSALNQTVSLLSQGGRLVVISFHEGEDRPVKQFLKNHTQAFTLLTKHPVTPTEAEITANPRSRSARLRAAVKL